MASISYCFHGLAGYEVGPNDLHSSIITNDLHSGIISVTVESLDHDLDLSISVDSPDRSEIFFPIDSLIRRRKHNDRSHYDVHRLSSTSSAIQIVNAGRVFRIEASQKDAFSVRELLYPLLPSASSLYGLRGIPTDSALDWRLTDVRAGYWITSVERGFASIGVRRVLPESGERGYCVYAHPRRMKPTVKLTTAVVVVPDEEEI